MIINELILNDFGIFSGRNHLHFASNSTGKNITLVGGMNGRGKTTILEAILLALYGKRSTVFTESEMTYSNYLKKCLNKNSAAKYTFIELRFTVPTTEKPIDITVKRSWVADKARIVDKVQVWRDSQPDRYLTENWDTFIEEILPVGISGLFFFDGEKIGRIAAQEETSDTMQDSIRSLLGINIVDRLLADLRRLRRRKANFTQDTGVLEELANKEKELKEVEQNLAIARQDLSHFSVKLQRYQNNIRMKEEAYLKQGGALMESRESLLLQREKLSEELYTKKAELVNITAGTLPLLMVEKLLKQIKETAKKDDSIKAASHVTNYLKNYNQKLSSIINNMRLTEQQKIEIIAHMTDEEKQLSEKSLGATTFDLSPVALQLIDDILDHKTNQQRTSTAEKLINKINELELQMEQIEHYMHLNADEKQSEGLLLELKQLNTKAMEAEAKIKVTADKISRLSKIKEHLDSQLQKLLTSAAEAKVAGEDAQRIVKYALLTEEKMREFKYKLTIKKLSLLGERITACFHHIIGKQSLASKIEIDPKTMRLTVHDKQGSVMKSQLSTGEKQILAVAILWGLAQSSGYKLPVIIDTPLGRLDSSHRANIVTRYLPYASHQVIVLSTDEEVDQTYLEMLENHINTKYLLQYNDKTKGTTVVEGYFQGKAS